MSLNRVVINELPELTWSVSDKEMYGLIEWLNMHAQKEPTEFLPFEKTEELDLGELSPELLDYDDEDDSPQVWPVATSQPDKIRKG